MSSWEIWPDGPSPRSVALAARRRSRSASSASCAASCSSSVFRRSSISATTPREALPITPRERSDKTTSKDQEHGHHDASYIRKTYSSRLLSCPTPLMLRGPPTRLDIHHHAHERGSVFCCCFCFVVVFIFQSFSSSDTTFQHPAHSHTLHSASPTNHHSVIDHHHRKSEAERGVVNDRPPPTPVLLWGGRVALSSQKQGAGTVHHHAPNQARTATRSGQPFRALIATREQLERGGGTASSCAVLDRPHGHSRQASPLILKHPLD